MSSKTVMNVMLAFYMAIFFGFLFGPLIVMGVSAFNTSTYPQVYPIEGLTLSWFDKLLNDRDMVYGLKNSLWIGMWVVVLSVPLGLAGRKKIPGLPAARADVFPAALVTMLAVAELGPFKFFHHSLHNLRWGLADEALAGKL